MNHMNIRVLVLVCVLFSTPLFSQNIQSPQEFLGYELGKRFTRHHKVVKYFTYVSNQLDNVLLEKYGETNEYKIIVYYFI